MAKWVECKSAVAGSIFINLDNVAYIAPVQGGSDVQFVGEDESFMIASSPQNILAGEKVHRA